MESLRTLHPSREIEVINTDANKFLQNTWIDKSTWRGVLFLDPYGAQVEWATIKKIARLEMLDTWILFPTATLSRNMPIFKMPDDARRRLFTKVFGDESWEALYEEPLQGNLFGDVERDHGTGHLVSLYKEKLKGLFGNRFLEKSQTFRNHNDSPLYEFIFCVGSPSPKAIAAAKKIAKHILEHI